MKLEFCPTVKRVAIGSVGACVLAAVACADGRGSPTSPSASAAVSSLAAPGPETSASSDRSGTLDVIKECSQFFSEGFCTITSSNVKAIEVGTRVVYDDLAAVGMAGGSAVTLELPGPGNNNDVFGRCELSETVQLCTFSGGTGKFTHFQATAHVSYLGGADYGWQGPYSFTPKN